MIILKILVAVVGVLMSLSYFPQAYLIYKNKSAKDVSLLSFSIFAFGTVVWVLYGLALHDMSIVASFSIGVVGSWLVLILKLMYK